MEIGWIGTGIMGAPMVRRLIGGGTSRARAQSLTGKGASARR